MKRNIRIIITAVLVILCFICLFVALAQAWNLALYNNRPFLRLVNGFEAYTKARIEIMFLKSYDTFSEAKSAIESEPDTLLFVQTDSFGIAPISDASELYIVKEKGGWKIENTFQFCRGHRYGITNSKNYLFIARLVQDQWNICIIFYDDRPHACYSNIEQYILYTYNDHGSGDVHQLVAISIGTDEEPFSIYIDGDSYELQDYEWTSSFENAS
jgi:hypothetical protein